MIRKNTNYQKRILWCAAILITLLVLSAYSNTLYAPFVLDDNHSFVKEPKVLSFTFDLVSFENLATTKFGLRRFLPMLTFALDLKWGGGNPAAFHLTNIAIHLLASLSLLFLLKSLFLFPKCRLSPQSRENTNLSTMLVVFVVGLWALNPVQTNAVTYVVQRMTSIATFFYFLSFGCYLRGRFHYLGHGASKKSLVFYLFSLVCFICAMMSKEIAATLPVMVFLIEWLLIEDSRVSAFLKRHKKTVVFLVFLITALISYKFYNGWLLSGYSNRHFTLFERLLTQLRVVSSYCGLLLLPLPMWLNLEHDVSLSTSLFSPLTTFFSLIFIISVLYLAWRFRRKKPLIAFAVYWFFINLSIESTIIPLELKFEHRLYLPSAGFYLAIVLLLREFYLHYYGDELSLNGAKVLISILLIICSGLSYLTYSRNIVWNSTISLYQDCVFKAPGKARTHTNLATAWLKKGEYDKALLEAEKGISLGIEGYEEYWVAAQDIVAGLVKQKKYDEAISRGKVLYAEASEKAKKNSYPLFLFNLGMAYLGVDDFQSAFDWFFKGYKFCYQNDFPETIGFEQSIVKALTLGLRQGYQFDSSMGLNADNVAVAEKMAQICFDLDNLDLSSKYVENVLTQDSKSLIANDLKREIKRTYLANSKQKKLGTLKGKYLHHPFASQFNFFMAICVAMEKFSIPGDSFLRYSLQQAEILSEDSPDLYIVKSWYFYKLKEYAKALEIIDRGIELYPEYAQLWVNRGIYALALKKDESLDDFNRALYLYPGHPHRKKILIMRNLAKSLLDKDVVLN